MITALEDVIVARLRKPPPNAYVVPNSTPVISFGDPSKALIATLGLNPSRQEFLDTTGQELNGSARRFESLTSLGVSSLSSASDAALQRVVKACNAYFQNNPYRRWFDQLEPVLQAFGTSYYNGSACHLDLVQWATDPVWSKIPDKSTRDRMLKEDSAFLDHQLNAGSFKVLLLNGSGVVRPFERMTGVSLRDAGSVRGSSQKSRMLVGRLPLGTRVIAWSVNIQSSFGICNSLRAAIASSAGLLEHEDKIP